MATPSDKEKAQRFSSRWALLLSVLGIAVGTGNIWRFPRIAAQNGGDEGAAAFLIAWICFLFLWSIPLIIAEYALGRRGRMGTVGTFIRVAGPKRAWMGAFIGFVATAIMFYYAVVAGWCIFYFFETLTNPLPFTTDAAMATWDQFQGPWAVDVAGYSLVLPPRPVLFHALAMGLGALACIKGVHSIERANKVLVPALLAIVLISVIRAITLEGSWDGIGYLFTPQFDQLTQPRLWLEALTQNAWDTGAGWGLILTYAAYMKRDHGTVKNAFLTGIGNNTVSLLAAVMIFGTVFAVLGREMSRPEILEVMRTSGPASTGLTFIWMPQLFAEMPFGRPLGVLFFLGLSFAAFSSLISMIALATRVLVDGGLKRATAIGSVAALGFLMGLPSAVNLEFFGNQDFVWGVALMVSGALIAYAVIRFGPTTFRKTIIMGGGDDWSLGPWWDVMIKYVVPVQAIVLLVWWMSLSATVYAPDEWFNPFNPYSVMTVLAQWTLVIVFFLSINKWMAKKTRVSTTDEWDD